MNYRKEFDKWKCYSNYREDCFDLIGGKGVWIKHAAPAN